MSSSSFDRVLALAAFLLLAYFVLFLHLDSLSLRLWDESRRAVNTWEMLHNGNWLVPHYEGKPDMWGTKPPLLIWVQTLFMSILGPNELAVRLPSALAALSLALLMIYFCWRHLGRPALGYFGAGALLTMQGYLAQAHSARTGDFDSILTLLMTTGLLAFFLLTESVEEQQRRRYLWLLAFTLIAAGLTKGIASLFFVPGMAVYALLSRQALPLLRWRPLYLAIGAYIFAVGGYYLVRELFNPGYIHAVWGNELAGRYVEGREGYHWDFFFYLRNMWQDRLWYWMAFVPPGIVLGLRAGGRLARFTGLLSLAAALLLLVISNSKTKMAWYEMPAFPALGLLAAIPIALAFESDLLRQQWDRPWQRYAFTAFFIAVFFLWPYWRAIDLVYLPRDTGHQSEKMQYGPFIRNNPDLKGYRLGLDELNAHARFYVSVYNSKGYNLKIDKLKKPLPPGTQVLVCDPIFQERLEKLHPGKLSLVREQGICRVMRVE